MTGLDRRVAVEALLHERGAALVVCGLGSPGYDVFAAGDHDGNFYLWGAMGGAALVGLGLALAQPARPVLVVTGDGEMLMGLGGLATIGARRPANLGIAVLDNGRYGETGMQESHTALGVDLCGVARAAGLAEVSEASDLHGIAALRSGLSTITGGPRFAVLRIAPDEVPRALPMRDGAALKLRMRAHLGFHPE